MGNDYEEKYRKMKELNQILMKSLAATNEVLDYYQEALKKED